VILLGGIGTPSESEMGGTQYSKVIQNALWGAPPKLDMAYEKRVQATIRELVRAKTVASAHDLGEGGLAVALAESSFGSANVGADILLDSNSKAEILLFHEGPSRILVTTDNPQNVLAVADRNNVHATPIGVTLEARVTIRNRNEILVDSTLAELKGVWAGALKHLLLNPVLV
jgi:phosphoribosylformylglycinamidine (FGAM) synthase-like enzyme